MPIDASRDNLTGLLGGPIGRFRPDPRIAGADGQMTISDIFQFARTAN